MLLGMTKPCQPEKNTAPLDIVKKAPPAKECESCGLDYCDCEICDEKVTIQVPPAE
jgi:hypothetical protein